MPSVEFMVVDIQCIDYVPRDVANVFDDDSFNEVCPQDCASGPCVALFGRTMEGKSIAVCLTNYMPWVRYEIPEGKNDADIQSFLQQERARGYEIKTLRKFYGYDGSGSDPTLPRNFKFLDVRYPTFKAAFFAQRRGRWPVTDSNQSWVAKFSNELGLVSWARLTAQLSDTSFTRWSTCDLETTCRVQDLVAIERNEIAPLKILSFDCEMYSQDGLFPRAEKGDSTILVCSTVWSYGSSETRVVRTHPGSQPILETFRDLIVREDPDIITGWNIYGFDFQFMWKEYEKLSRPYKRGHFTTRFAGTPSTFVEKTMASAAKGDNTYRFWSLEGRVPVDLMQIIKDDKKPEDNTLKFVASLFLENMDKLDVTPQEMFEAWRTQDPVALERVAVYCDRDSEIPIALLQKLTYVPTWIELSRVCFTPLTTILNSGQQRRVYNVISKFVHNKFAINLRDSGWPAEEVLEDDEKRKSDYQGATVIEPQSGFYKSPVSVLDFESLYPSIIIYFNLCPSVLVLNKDLKVPKDTHTITHPLSTGTEERTYAFAKHIPGVLPDLLRHLLKTRKAVKAQMNTATGFEKFVLNGRQNALKIVCNSVYGFCGVSLSKGLLPCKPVAAVTTLKGRAFIDAAQTYVETTWPGSKVLYGDTDSIMVLWPLKPDGTSLSIAEAYALGDTASAGVTQVLQSGSIAGLGLSVMAESRFAVKLANEKVECPYLLIRKKMYAAVKHTPGKTGFTSELEFKGIDAVRRDRTKVVRDLSEQVLDALMIKSDVLLAQTILSTGLTKMLRNEVPLEDYSMSKSLRGTYASENLPHVMAWKRMKARGDSGLPPLGSRMPFLITMPKSPVPLYELAEHPEYVKKASLRPWALYYIENIRSVMERLLEPTGIPVSRLFDEAESKAKTIQSGTRSLKDSVDTGITGTWQESPKKKAKQDTKSGSLKAFL